MSEIWLPVIDAANYEISNYGRLRRYKNDGSVVDVIGNVHEHGHIAAGITRKTRYFHRLVLEAFIGPCPEGMECRHLDGDAGNNRLENLAWGTPIENGEDKVRHGTMKRVEPKDFDVFNPFDNFIPVERLYSRESWKEVPGLLGIEVSSYGNVRTFWCTGRGNGLVDTPRLLKTYVNPQTGYPQVVLSGKPIKKTFAIHRLVMMAFHPKPDADVITRHLDGDKTNSRLSNLCWGTRQENARDNRFQGKQIMGRRCWLAKLDDPTVAVIKQRLLDGEKGRSLAREYGVSPSVICVIRKGRSWRHVEPLKQENA